MSLFTGFFDERVAMAEGAIADHTAALFPEEESHLANAVTKRRLEFSAGRTLARGALAQLGLRPRAIPKGADRAPVWPPGIVGSITHTDTYCAAAVARAMDGIQGIGIDLEPLEPIEEELWTELAANELGWVGDYDASERGVIVRAIFCAKECAFKAQFPLSGALLEFGDFSVSIDRAGETFAARFMRDAGPFKTRDTLVGRLRFGSGHIAAGLAIEHPA